MKIYLVLLCVSLISRFIIVLETKIYQKKYFNVVKKPTFSENVVNRCKDAVLIAMIFPYFLTLMTLLFLNQDFYKNLGDSIKNSEYFEEKTVDK